ncbi:aminotransferase-like domain-containing protein [Salinibius halmophilus]|uniref:aminotransferase-like domain-containing protein n=1 Tax=Salinibius halmophilus TaxID=1853216 RepID=UPI000E66BE12|nr:PLP-dependent aminotransferase family protein [Salinibius halmophilus]
MFSNAALQIESSFIRDILAVSQQPGMISLAGGMPASELLPWPQLQAQFGKLSQGDLQYSLTPGLPALREQVAKQLVTDCDISGDEIMITTGSQQGLDLITRTLINPGDKIIVEAPTFLGALQTFQASQADILAVPTSPEGPDMDALTHCLETNAVKFIYLQPNFQNPTGFSYTLARRQQLAELARRYNVLIVEDDPYGALRYEGEALPSLYSMVPEHCVRLVSFSKTVAPGLRLGWLQASSAIQMQLNKFKQVADLHSSSLNQQLLVAFLQSPDFDAHIQTLLNVYRQRCDAMHNALSDQLGDQVSWQKPQGGMFFWLNLHRDGNWKPLFDSAIRENVAYVPGAAFYFDKPSQQFARLSFSNVSAEQITQGIERLAQVFNEATV